MRRLLCASESWNRRSEQLSRWQAIDCCYWSFPYYDTLSQPKIVAVLTCGKSSKIAQISSPSNRSWKICHPSSETTRWQETAIARSWTRRNENWYLPSCADARRPNLGKHPRDCRKRSRSGTTVLNFLVSSSWCTTPPPCGGPLYGRSYA